MFPCYDVLYILIQQSLYLSKKKHNKKGKQYLVKITYYKRILMKQQGVNIDTFFTDGWLLLNFQRSIPLITSFLAFALA